MSQKATVTDPNAVEPTQPEIDLRGKTALHTMVGTIVKQAQEQWTEELASELREYQVPQRESVAQVLETSEPVDHQRQQFRYSSPTEPFYRHFSEEERHFRNPDTDHWNAEWIRGMTFKNPQMMLEADAQLERLHPEMYRATTVEGAAGAAGAINVTTGGALLPRPMESIVLIARDKVSKMRRFANSFRMTRQTHSLPTAGAMTAYITAEQTTATQGEGTFAAVQFTARKVQAKAIASTEMLEDAAINLVNIFAERAGGAIGVVEEVGFWQGTGISAGLTGTAFAENTSTALSFSDVVDMYYNVEQQYRTNANWFIAANVLKMLTELRNATTGTQFYLGLTEKPGPITDDPTAEGTLMRRPVYEVQAADGYIAFGDARAAYTVAERRGVGVKASEHARMENGEVLWIFDTRVDGNNVDTVAAQVATGIATVNDVVL